MTARESAALDIRRILAKRFCADVANSFAVIGARDEIMEVVEQALLAAEREQVERDIDAVKNIKRSRFLPDPLTVEEAIRSIRENTEKVRQMREKITAAERSAGKE